MALIYLLLGSLTKHTLILTVVVKSLQVLLALLGYLIEHVIALTESVPAFDLLFGLLLAHGSLEFIAVGTSLTQLLILHVLLLLLVDLLLELDDGAPFIDTTLGILWVVPLIIIGKCLQLLTLVLHRLLDTLGMHPQWINKVVSHLSLYTF